VTEKVLDYHEAQCPQETYYWCGPASTEMVLSVQGIDATEQQLAAELGTHSGGTDSIAQFPPVLNSYIPVADYTFRNMGNDPPTALDKDDLWYAITSSIDAGYGVVANIIAPPGNYPVGVKGSPTLSYGGGTVYHYIALLGYDDEYPAVYWADSGFQPFWSWVSFDQTASLIAGKGYAYATNIPEGVEMPDYAQLSFEQLAGPDADTGAYGWPQLGGRTVVDALGAIGEQLGVPGFGGEPPLSRTEDGRAGNPPS
jgi:hypothetical protein